MVQIPWIDQVPLEAVEISGVFRLFFGIKMASKLFFFFSPTKYYNNKERHIF
jgi:hypothetical protein